MEFVLETSSLCKKYKNQYAVNNVDMKIARGDIYGFIGENGAGKTTIIRLVTGLANPTSGRYKLFGVDSLDKAISKTRRRLSAVVETPSVALNMSGYDNLLMHAKLIGLTDLTYIDEILKVTGLSYVRKDKKKAKNYSLGMKQRLGIAVAMLGHPDFIILDEPMNGLDPEGIVEIRELILKLNKEQNITFIISSHILDELSKVATKYGFIHKGKLLKELTREELQEECKKCLELVVDDISKIPQVLEGDLKVQNYKILQDNIVRIYEDVDITELMAALALADIKTLKMNSKNENIEEYYLNLMGGTKND